MDVLERIENGELQIMVCGGNELIKVPSYCDSNELLRLAKLGKQMQWVSVKVGCQKLDK